MVKKDHWIIHIFALLHFAIALSTRLLNLSDELLLTLITMLMAITLCQRRRINLTFTTIILIAVNISGLFLGEKLAVVLRPVIQNRYVVGPLSTFITTEIIGWAVYGSAIFINRYTKQRPSETKKVHWFLVAFIIVLIIRLIRLLVFSENFYGENVVLNVIVDYVFSCAAMFYVSEYAISEGMKLEIEKGKAHQAQYSYLRLKQQVKPHFLFNTLNILDTMVSEGKNEQASTYIHKLANVYRYMIRNEQENLVYLEDELDFVIQYIDLLKVRFGEGFDVPIEIPSEAMRYSIVPCCLQLLVENATKHNVISEYDPLVVRISIDGDYIKVENRIRAKKTSDTSTNLGLNYIRQQYRDIAGKEIIIDAGEENYIVRLPLILQ